MYTSSSIIKIKLTFILIQVPEDNITVAESLTGVVATHQPPYLVRHQSTSFMLYLFLTEAAAAAAKEVIGG